MKGKHISYTVLVISLFVGGFFFSHSVNQVNAAQDLANTDRLIISTIERPPFVIQSDNGRLNGFSIDLWEEISLRARIPYEFTVETEFASMLNNVRTGTSDAAIANITITAERERDMDFSLPIYNSGLQIAVPKQTKLFSAWKPFSDPQVWEIIAILLVIWFVALHALWLSGRRNHALFRNKYPVGLYDAFSWLSLEQLRRDIPHTTTFQFIAIFLRVFSVASMFMITAIVASYLTIDHLRNDIVVYQDLFGKQVGVTGASTPQKFMQQQNIPTIAYSDLNKMKSDLEQGVLDAIIHDAPVLQYYAKTEGTGKVTLIPSIFKPEQFGMLFTDGHPLRETVNDTLLRMQEDGSYQAIYDKWFTQ